MLDLVTRQQNPDANPSRELLGRRVHLERHWGPVSVTIFEGAHEQLPGALKLIASR